MKTWIKRTLFAVMGSVVLLGGLAACGHRMDMRHGGMSMSAEDAAKWRGKMIEKAGKELQLDEPQKQKLGALFDKVHEQHKNIMASNPNPKADLQALISGERFDKARAQALVEEKTTAVRTKSPEVIAAMAEFYDALKPEQQAKLREWLAKSGHHRMGGHS